MNARELEVKLAEFCQRLRDQGRRIMPDPLGGPTWAGLQTESEHAACLEVARGLVDALCSSTTLAYTPAQTTAWIQLCRMGYAATIPGRASSASFAFTRASLTAAGREWLAQHEEWRAFIE